MMDPFVRAIVEAIAAVMALLAFLYFIAPKRWR